MSSDIAVNIFFQRNCKIYKERMKNRMEKYQNAKDKYQKMKVGYCQEKERMQNISTNIKKKQITLKTTIPTQCWYLYQSIEIAHNVKSSLVMKIVIEQYNKRNTDWHSLKVTLYKYIYIYSGCDRVVQCAGHKAKRLVPQCINVKIASREEQTLFSSKI